MRGRRPRSRRRILAVGILAVLLAAVAVTTAGVVWLRTSLPTLDGRLNGLAGLERQAAITRDSRGVLYITAETPADASFALGFAHAQDRLWQMELTRRIGTGRLAEMVGEAGLTVDRMIRTLGLHRLAESNLDRLSPEARGHVEAYSAGVNAYLTTRTGALPPEFELLRHAPEPWRPADSLLWGRLMSLQLAGNWFGEILRARMLKAGLSPADLETLWAVSPDAASTPTAPSLAGVDALGGERLAALDAALPEEIAPRLASNAWALDGSRTPTGKPVLAGDPHLGLSDPSVWTLARIDAPGYRRTGAFVPGVPFLVIGHNDSVAWTMTTTHSDTQDLFVERLDPADPGRYLTPEGSAAFTVRTEVIRAGGSATEHRVRTTRHGPVVSDALESAAEAAADGTVLALASTVLLDDDDTAEALFRMGAAGDVEAFVEALRGFHGPQQNVFFADTSGGIGMVSAGRVPLRAAGDGFLPVPGWTGEYDWTGIAGFASLPAALAPPSGVLVNANNPVVGREPGLYLGRDFDAPYRARRILARLAAADGSVDAMAAAQLDTVSLFARDLVPVLLDTVSGIAPDATSASAIGLLRAWDGDMAANRPEPVVFAAWIETLHQRLFADELGALLPRYQRVRAETLIRILTDDQRWCDDRRTPAVENCRDVAAGALSEALAGMTRRFGTDISAWRWGEAHQAVFEHRVWGRIPVIGGALERRAPTGGGDYTVSRGSWTGGDEPAFRHGHGAALRVVFDLADLDRSRFVVALGASGNPFSPFHDSWQHDWARGGSFRIGREPDIVRSRLELGAKPR